MAAEAAGPSAVHPLPAEGDDRHLREACLDSLQVYRGHFLDVRRDRIALPNGQEAAREYIVHPGAAVIVPILDDGRLVLERQYRYPMGRSMIEFPAGKLEPGEPSLRCAMRELREETGYEAREWAKAGLLHNAIAYSNEHIDIWFARGLTPGHRHLDDEEFLDVLTATEDDLCQWAMQGRLTDAKTLTCLLWLQQWRAGRWALDWQAVPIA
jgi:ADP-ribose pyrophosphatase